MGAQDDATRIVRQLDEHVCPYCASTFLGGVIACAGCGRDLGLLALLRSQIPADARSARQSAPPVSPFLRSILCYGLATVALLGASVTVQYVFDGRLEFLFGFAFLIPLVFGYSLSVRLADRRRLVLALLLAAVASAVNVFTLGLIPYFAGEAGLLPSTPAEWKEAAQFIIVILAAYWTGHFLAQAVRWHYAEGHPHAMDGFEQWFLPEHLENADSAARASKFKRLLALCAAALSAAMSALPALTSLLSKQGQG